MGRVGLPARDSSTVTRLGSGLDRVSPAGLPQRAQKDLIAFLNSLVLFKTAEP